MYCLHCDRIFFLPPEEEEKIGVDCVKIATISGRPEYRCRKAIEKECDERFCYHWGRHGHEYLNFSLVPLGAYIPWCQTKAAAMKEEGHDLSPAEYLKMYHGSIQYDFTGHEVIPGVGYQKEVSLYTRMGLKHPDQFSHKDIDPDGIKEGDMVWSPRYGAGKITFIGSHSAVFDMKYIKVTFDELLGKPCRGQFDYCSDEERAKCQFSKDCKEETESRQESCQSVGILNNHRLIEREE